MHALLSLMLALLPVDEAQAISFSPSVVDLSTEPGVATSAALTVGNTADAERTYSVSLYAVDFEETSGEPMFRALPDALQGWLTADDFEFSLAAGASRALTITAAPPVGVTEDSYTVAVVVRESEAQDGFFLSSGVSSLLFVTVGSPAVELEVQSLQAPWLSSHLPVDITSTLANAGERVGQPYGFVRIVNTFGGEVARLEVNPLFHRVPAGVARDFTVTWGEANASHGFFAELWREVTNFKVGIFTAELVAAPYPGADGLLRASTRFLVFPWRIALLATCMAVVTVLLLRRQRRKRW